MDKTLYTLTDTLGDINLEVLSKVVDYNNPVKAINKVIIENNLERYNSFVLIDFNKENRNKEIAPELEKLINDISGGFYSLFIKKYDADQLKTLFTSYLKRTLNALYFHTLCYEYALYDKYLRIKPALQKELVTLAIRSLKHPSRRNGFNIYIGLYPKNQNKEEIKQGYVTDDISNLDLSVRCLNTLRRNNINKIEDLEKMSLSEIKNIKNFGKHDYRNLLLVLSKYNTK